MFDFGFWEITLIGVITLILIGPEKIPSVANKAGAFFGKVSKIISNIKKNIQKYLDIDDEKSDLSKTIKKAKNNIKTKGEKIKDVLKDKN